MKDVEIRKERMGNNQIGETGAIGTWGISVHLTYQFTHHFHFLSVNFVLILSI